jgi:site-specific DNA-cytosine methylase
VAALTSNGVGTCGADDNQAQAGHLIPGKDAVVRRLTELECERLQGYPDGWTDGQSASARYRQLGNSVAVPAVEWIAMRLVAIDAQIGTAE